MVKFFFLILFGFLNVSLLAVTKLVEEDMFDEFDDEELTSPLQNKGFIDLRYGPRFVKAVENGPYTLGELRINNNLEFSQNQFLAKASVDLFYSPLSPEYVSNLQYFSKGKGLLDLRELSVGYSLFGKTDIKMGRQILTWGTGDLLFVNDLFPKDWQSFFIGRQNQYLKAPSNSLKISQFHQWFTLDLVYNPFFNSDRYIEGTNIEYFNPYIGQITGESNIIKPNQKTFHFKNGEYAARLHKVIKGFELDLYYYQGFWKTPEGVTNLGQLYFPQLVVSGASIRAPLGGGMANLEYGHYYSPEDKGLRTAFVRNSEDRVLLGFERELFRNFTITTQSYLEYMNHFSQYSQDFASSVKKREKYHIMLTLRLEYALLNQNLRVSLFHFYSPTNQDYYIRNRASYKYNDHLNVDLGINYFDGTTNHSFWSQFYTNSNAYVGFTFLY